MTAEPAPRTRFCPAPSGWLHVGGARTALFNWLHARGQGGTFVLRIEDTDADRATAESATGMLAALRFLGLAWDEGPEVGGAFGPYRQGERLALYQAVARRLLTAGFAYEAFETAEELDADRQRAQQEGRTPGYSGAHRDLSDADKQAFRDAGRASVLRLRTPDEGSVVFDDLVRGSVEFGWADIPDFVIQRADASPTYYLANTVDDLAQGITLVARGEDLLSATPRQLLLTDRVLAGDLLDEALAETGLAPREEGWQRPQAYAHLPIIVGEDRKKLSKRHGSVAVDEFRRQGFLPEVLVNFLALCGWGWDDHTERFTVDELIEKFSFDRVGRNPAMFDTDKLRSLNGDRLKELADDELAERLVPAFVEAGMTSNPPAPGEQELLARFAPLLRERIQTLAEAPPLVAFAFADEITYDDKAVAKHLKGRAGEVLDAAESLLAEVTWDGEVIETRFRELAENLDLGVGKVMQPVRVAVTGTAVSPPLPQTLAVLDRELVLERLRAAKPLVTT